MLILKRILDFWEDIMAKLPPEIDSNQFASDLLRMVGKRRLRSLSNLQEAEREAGAVVALRSCGAARVLTLSADHALSHKWATSVPADFDVSMDGVAAESAQVVRRLRGHSLDVSVDFSRGALLA